MRKKFLSLLLSTVLVASVCFAAISVARILVNSSDKWSGTEPVKITNLGSPYKHCFDDLSTLQKHAYNEILKNVYSMPQRIVVPEITKAELEDVFVALLADNPDLYFMEGVFGYGKNMLRTVCEMSYAMTAEEYREAEAKIESVCEKVISGLSNPDDQWQTELEIHDYIIDNCEYKFDEENGLEYSTVHSVFVNGLAACEGYSKAAKMLFDMVGIESMTVRGEGINKGVKEGHMWNIVNIDGEYYHLDCTWDDPVAEEEIPNYILAGVKSYGFFNVSDEMIKDTHIPDEDYVECTATEGYYYRKTEKYFDKYNEETEEKILRHVSEAISDGENSVTVIFADREAYELAVTELGTKGVINDFFAKKERETDKNFVRDNLWHNPEDLTVTVVIEYE